MSIIHNTRILKTESGDVYDFSVRYDEDFKDASERLSLTESYLNSYSVLLDAAYANTFTNSELIEELSTYAHDSVERIDTDVANLTANTQTEIEGLKSSYESLHDHVVATDESFSTSINTLTTSVGALNTLVDNTIDSYEAADKALSTSITELSKNVATYYKEQTDLKSYVANAYENERADVAELKAADTQLGTNIDKVDTRVTDLIAAFPKKVSYFENDKKYAYAADISAAGYFTVAAGSDQVLQGDLYLGSISAKAGEYSDPQNIIGVKGIYANKVYNGTYLWRTDGTAYNFETAIANDSQIVHTKGNEYIDGVKTFAQISVDSTVDCDTLNALTQINVAKDSDNPISISTDNAILNKLTTRDTATVSGLTSTADSTFNSNVKIEGTLDVVHNVTVSENLTTYDLTVSNVLTTKDAQVNNQLTVQKELSAANATVTGTLNVEGSATVTTETVSENLTTYDLTVTHDFNIDKLKFGTEPDVTYLTRTGNTTYLNSYVEAEDTVKKENIINILSHTEYDGGNQPKSASIILETYSFASGAYSNISSTADNINLSGNTTIIGSNNSIKSGVGTDASYITQSAKSISTYAKNNIIITSGNNIKLNTGGVSYCTNLLSYSSANKIVQLGVTIRTEKHSVEIPQVTATTYTIIDGNGVTEKSEYTVIQTYTFTTQLGKETKTILYGEFSYSCTYTTVHNYGSTKIQCVRFDTYHKYDDVTDTFTKTQHGMTYISYSFINPFETLSYTYYYGKYDTTGSSLGNPVGTTYTRIVPGKPYEYYDSSAQTQTE